MEHYREAPVVPRRRHIENGERWRDVEERRPPTDVLEVMPSLPGTTILGLGRRKLLGLGVPIKLMGALFALSFALALLGDDYPTVRGVRLAITALAMSFLLAICSKIAFWHRDREWVEIDGARLVVRRRVKRRIDSAALADVREAVVMADLGVVQVRGLSPCLVVGEGLGHDLAALQWIARMINQGLERAREQPDARI